jgi:cytochrome c
MRSVLLALLPALTVALTTAPVHASPELARKHGCISCHAAERKLTGPAYRDIAARYSGQPDAVGKLSEKIRAGGSGAWGRVVMPPHRSVPDAELTALVTWVLATR